MVREVPVMWLRLAERCARGSGAGAAAQDASASAARSSRSGRVRERMARRAHGSRPDAVTAQHRLSYPAQLPTTSTTQSHPNLSFFIYKSVRLTLTRIIPNTFILLLLHHIIDSVSVYRRRKPGCSHDLKQNNCVFNNTVWWTNW